MAHFQPSYDATAKIIDALGLTGQRVARLVIDIKACDAIRAYVELLPDGDEIKRLAVVLSEHRHTIMEHDAAIPDVTIDAGIKTC
jgi:hypothetical protein